MLAQSFEALYFAYGSNMSVRRIRARVTSARVIGTATLHGHRLGFRKVGRDGSGKCDVEQTDQHHDRVLGVLFRLQQSDISTLDRFEGRGKGYEQKRVRIITQQGRALDAITYYATHIDHALPPYHWYKAHVLTGALEHKLPADYIRMIEGVTAIHDPDPDRHAQELAIYHPPQR